jgi:predicted Zn-dependent peptidase
VGNANFDEICDYFERNFESENKKIKVIKPNKINKKAVEERKGLDQAQFILGMHCPDPGTHDFSVLSVLDAYLGDGMSSKLFLEIREKRGLAYAIKSAIDPERNSPYYAIYVGTTKENIEEVEKLIVEEFNKVEEMTEDNLKEAKERIIGLKHIASEDSSEVMDELIFAELSGGAEKYYDSEKSVEKVTLEEVKKLAKNLIKNYGTAAIVPE